ncbi:MAG: S8 family serine peptidase [Bacteroidota bacterium]
MKRFATRLWLLSALAAFGLLAAPAGAQAPSGPTQPGPGQFESGVIQIKLSPATVQQLRIRTSAAGFNTGVAELDQLNARFGASEMRRVFRPAGRHEARHRAWGLDRWYVVEFDGPTNAQAALASYSASPSIEIAERRLEKTLHGSRLTLDAPPDDTLYDRQWHYDNDGTVSPNAIADADVDLPEAWAIETGHPDVIVQIVDSGIDSDHPDFAGMLWVNEGEDVNGNGVFDNFPAADGGDLNGVDDDNNGFVDDIIGYNHADDVSVPEAGADSEGGSGSHGVHVAGTVAARSNDGFGAAGVAGGNGSPDSGVRLMISQTFGNSAVDGFAESIVYGADNGAVIANHSWGYTNIGAFEQAVLDAIDYFVANAGGEGSPIQGGLFVSSAGNSGLDGEAYPGFYEPALAVSSLGVANQRSLFNSTGSSNFGTWVDVAGPGGDFATNNVVEELVLSPVIAGEGTTSGLPNHDYYQGTSMSSPHVAGVAALVASYEHRQGNQLTAEQLRARVASPNTTKDIDGFNPGFEGQLGVGMASAFLAITNPEGDGTAPDAVTDLSVDDVIGNAVVVSFTVPEDDESPAGGAGVGLEAVTGLDLRYSTEPITEETFALAFPADLGLEGPVPPAGESVSATIENLDFEQTYFFAVKSTDRFGNESALSNVAEGMTGGAPFSVSPSSFTETLEAGTTASRALTITNESTRNVAFDFEIVGAAPEAVEFAPLGASGAKLAAWEAANARAWAGTYARGPEQPGDYLRIDPRVEAIESRPARPALMNSPLNIAAGSYNVFSIEEGYGVFDLGLPGTWNLVNGDTPEIWAADFARGVDDRMFGYTLSTGTPEDNVFGSIDYATGVFTPIGDGWDHAGFPLDLVGDLTTGDLYVLSSEDAVYTVNRFTGETELVVEVPDAAGVNTVAIDDMGVMYGHDVIGDRIVTIDLETGAVTEVGPTGFDANFVQGMDFDPSTGRLYLSAYNNGVAFGEKAELRIADRQTGNTVFVSKINGDGYGEYPFLAIPGEGFLTTNLISVTLRPGRSVDVDLTLDATSLLAGDYDAAVRVVATGLPGEPTVDVPVALTVTGDPVASVDSDALDFGEEFVNGTETRAFLVENSGVDVLEVIAIEVDNAEFSVLGTDAGESAFSLDPSESAVVGVAFSPVDLGEESGTITVSTNDPANPTLTIAVTGTGIPAPEIGVEPTAFDLQAYQGQTYTRSFTISNTGGSPLEYQILEEAIAPTASERVLLLSEDFENGFPESWTVVTNGDPNVPWQLASDYGSPTAPNYASTGDAAMANSDLGQFLGGPSFDTEMWTPAMTYQAGFDLEYTLNFQEFFGDDFLDVDISTDGGTTWTQLIQYTEDTCSETVSSCFTDLPAGTKEVLPLDAFVNEGDEFIVRWHFYTTEETSWEWWATVDDVAIVRNVEWLTTSPIAGTIEPGGSEEVTVSINADLPAGEYGANLLVTSNDPVSSGEIVDIDLTVVESVTVAPTPDADDLEVHPNEEFLVPVTVASLQDLGVESYQFTLFFDEDLLMPLGIETAGTLSEGTTTAVNTSEAGQISVAVAEAVETASGASATLFTIEPMDIDGDSPVLVFVRLKAKEMLGDAELSFNDTFQFNEGTPPVSTGDGNVSVVPLLGDVSLNVEVSSFDASLVLDAVVDAVDLTAAATAAADVSDDGTVSALDASLILRFAIGDITCFPAADGCDAGARVATSDASATGGLVAWGQPEAAGPEAARTDGSATRVRMPLELTASESVYAVEVEVPVDPAAATVATVEPMVPDGWVAAHRVEDGVLRIALSGATPLPSGAVAAVTLERHRPDAPLFLGGSARLGEAASVKVADVAAEPLPVEFGLRGNYPNPFTAGTRIAFDLPADADVTVEVFDAIGRRVFEHTADLRAGARRTVSLQGADFPAGVYVYRVVAEMGTGTEAATGRMTVVR